MDKNLLKALKQLRDEGPVDNELGICWNTLVNYRYMTGTEFLAEHHLYTALGKYFVQIGLNRSWPLGGPIVENDCIYNKWDLEKPIGRQRWNLLHSIIKIGENENQE